MRALVTGARGLLGAELCQQLTQQGMWVMGVDNGFRGGKKPLCDSFVETDLANGCDLPCDFDYIFHMAAINGTDYFYSIPNQLLQNNLLVDLSMFKFAAGCQNLKNFVYASSSEVVSGNLQQPVREITDITLHNSLNPRWSYRLAKMCGEHFLFNSQLPWLIVRYFNVYGPNSRSGHFIFDLRHKISQGDFTLIGADETRSFCHVSDAAAATLQLLQHSKILVNVGSDEEITVLDAANIVAHALSPKQSIEWHCLPGRSGSARRRRPDIGLLKQIYPGFKPRNFQQGIAECTTHWLHQSLT